MPKNETVSVVIPLYNAAGFIAETITSILNQSYEDLHVYVVDDFSTDGSDAVVKKIAAREPRVSYHAMSKKGGCPAPTKNEGVRLSKGTYVAFSDHDDWWHKDKIAKQVAFLESNGEVNLLGCNVEIVDTEQGISLGNFWRDPSALIRGNMRALVLEGPIFATTTCMIGRREFLLAHPFDERFIGSDEYDLSLHSTLDNPKQVALLPETLAYWRWHSASLSHSPRAAERALRDETLFSEKILKRPDISGEEADAVRNRLRMVIRRAGNAELGAGNTSQARLHYSEAASRGDRMSKAMLVASRISPKLSSSFTSWKRSRSHAKPTFR